MITSLQIRNELKQWDRFFGHKPSRTQAILDKRYARVYVNFIAQYSKDFVKKMSDNGMVFDAEVKDCDNFANVFNVFFYLQWIRDFPVGKLEPALFRCVIRGDRQYHAISMAFTYNGLYFIEPQTGDFWSLNTQRPEIIAVT